MALGGMKRRDGRSLNHKTLGGIRIRAVERVQAGESPEVVIRTLGFTRSCIYSWPARYRRCPGWMRRGSPFKARETSDPKLELRAELISLRGSVCLPWLPARCHWNERHFHCPIVLS
jgi:hypothetical protein